MVYSILYALVTLILLFVLFLTGVRPVKTLGWVLVLLLLPVMGMVLFLMFGLNRRRYKFSRIQRSPRVQAYQEKVASFYHSFDEQLTRFPPEMQRFAKLSRLILRNANLLPYRGNSARLLRNGPATFEAMLADMEQAEHFIHMQFYIFEEGELADRLLELFERKVGQGVEVRLLYDGIGSRQLSRSFLRKLREAGIKAYGYLPLKVGWIVTTVNYRNHRKITIVDGRVGYTGGINVSDKYLKGDPQLGIWHDMHLRLEGPVVNSLQSIFAVDWQFASQSEALLQPEYLAQPEPAGPSTVQLVAGGPDSDHPAIRQQYFTLLNEAQKYVYIINPYVIPGEAVLEALKTAALSGVDVRLLVPEKSDNIVVKWSIRSYFQELLESEVRIFLYPDGFLHSKVMVADDVLASVGTANLDFRSFEQNFEVNAVMYDRAIATQLRSWFLEDLEKSRELMLDEHLERPWDHRLLEGVAKLFSPIL